MPWQETLLMDQRVQFIADYQRDVFDVAELARRFGISRKTAYKWIDRYDAAGPAGLTAVSRTGRHWTFRCLRSALALERDAECHLEDRDTRPWLVVASDLWEADLADFGEQGRAGTVCAVH